MIELSLKTENGGNCQRKLTASIACERPTEVMANRQNVEHRHLSSYVQSCLSTGQYCLHTWTVADTAVFRHACFENLCEICTVSCILRAKGQFYTVCLRCGLLTHLVRTSIFCRRIYKTFDRDRFGNIFTLILFSFSPQVLGSSNKTKSDLTIYDLPCSLNKP